MDQLDCMIRDRNLILEHWKDRLEREREINTTKRHDIQITVDTLAWFLWMIAEFEKGK